MSTTTPTRTWSAELVFLHGTVEERVPAAPSRWDTLRETTKSAELEAAEYLRAGIAGACRVELTKHTKTHGSCWDRTGAYLWVEDGAVYRQGAR
jgi:hypothetical protein